MHYFSKDNPCGLDGFAFLEFSGPDQQALKQQFIRMGFDEKAHHKHEPITWFQQGNIQFIVNATQNSQAARHAKTHGPGACAMGFRVHDAEQAFHYALQQGATAFDEETHHTHGLHAIQAIGGSVIYFVDAQHSAFQDDWIMNKAVSVEKHTGLIEIDHLTHNVFRGNMDTWAAFYEKLFNFQEIRFFNIKGIMTGLVSRALSSPCGKIKIPLNESKDDRSQIEEFLTAYQGEGIQHIALTTDNIYSTIKKLKDQGVTFLDVPDTYYEMIHDRVPWHTESIEQLQKLKI
ncbi:MAG: 4-hydroxyphenylpyruvate dioxygenase, partial [Legionellaceae bacterium]